MATGYILKKTIFTIYQSKRVEVNISLWKTVFDRIYIVMMLGFTNKIPMHKNKSTCSADNSCFNKTHFIRVVEYLFSGGSDS